MELPARFGPYTLLRKIGQGGMAEVYVARQQSHLGVERLIALKMIRSGFLGEELTRFKLFFQREAQITASMSHQNIIHLYDVGEVNGVLYLTMELINGVTVSQLMRRHELPLAQALFIVGEMLSGLSYIHLRQGLDGEPLGLIHRDISPQNVLLSYSGAVKLSDFGIAKATASRSTYNTSEDSKGKFSYMSPEQAYGLPLDHRTDLFSTGIMLFELATGTRLYGGQNLNNLQLLSRARRAMIPDPRGLKSDIPEPLRELLVKALQKNPEDRFADAESMSQALRQVRAQLPYTSQDLAGDLTAIFAEERQQKQLLLQQDNRLANQLLESEGSTAVTKPLGADEATLRGVQPQLTVESQLPSSPNAQSGGLIMPDTNPGDPFAPGTSPGDPSVPDTNPSDPQGQGIRRLIHHHPAPRGHLGLYLTVALLAGGALLLGSYALWSSRSHRTVRPRVEGQWARARDLSLERSTPTDRSLPTVDAARPVDLPLYRPERSDSPRAPAKVKQAGGWATLSVGAKPWARVYLDGRYLGNTPLVNRRVRAGAHHLHIYCPATGRSRQERLELAPKKKVRRIFDLK